MAAISIILIYKDGWEKRYASDLMSAQDIIENSCCIGFRVTQHSGRRKARKKSLWD